MRIWVTHFIAHVMKVLHNLMQKGRENLEITFFGISNISISLLEFLILIHHKRKENKASTYPIFICNMVSI